MYLSQLWNKGLARISGSAQRKRRRALISRFEKQFGGRIAYGPFQGMLLPTSSSWSRSDRAAMMFGLYEQEVLASILDRPPSCRTFVDIGAADGYYPVGALTAGHYDKAIAFEATEAGRACIAEAAKLNEVDRAITILGLATKDSLNALAAQIPEAMIVMDIEGAEFDLLDEEAIALFWRHHFIIELHDFRFADGTDRREALRSRLSRYFEIRTLHTGARDPSAFPELHDLPDADRWAICSERRPRLMQWWRLDPLSK
jgi:hypothetical protein